MRIEAKENSWDIFGILFLTFIFVFIILFFPDLSLIRILFGIPFLIFFPGYVLTAFLFPRKRKENPPNIEKREYHAKKVSNISKRIDARDENVNVKDVEERGTINKNIDGPIRIALSVALSLGIVPVIGFILNELYTVNEKIFGLRSMSILLSIFFFINFFGSLSLIRRMRIPKHERFGIKIRIGPFSDGTRTDKFITSILVIMILISAGVGLYLYKYHHENEKYTEFFILGPEKTIADFPTMFNINEEKRIFLGINNHEYSKQNYTLFVFLDKRNGSLEQIDKLTGLVLKRQVVYTTNIEVDHNQRYLEKFTFSIPHPGLFFVYFELYKEKHLYRSLKLRTQVFEEGDIISINNDTLTFYLTGPGGIPSGIHSKLHLGENLPVELGLINHFNRSMSINLTISISEPEFWIPINTSNPLIIIDNITGAFLSFELPPETKVQTSLEIQLPQGDHEISFTLNRHVWDLTITKNIVIL